MLKNRIKTIRERGEVFHEYSGIRVQCDGRHDCPICRGESELLFQKWESSVPFPIPPKGKKYKNPLKQASRGKTIVEICFSCREAPCYMCSRTKCKEWQKEIHRKGQEEGCSRWENGRCREFTCEKGLITISW